MKKLSILCFLLLASCSTVEVKTAPLKMPEVNAPSVVPMNMKQVNFGTTKVNKETVFTLTPENLGYLDNNIIEMRRFILSEEARIKFYKDLSDSMELTIDQYNKSIKK